MANNAPPPGVLSGLCKNRVKRFDSTSSRVVYVRMPIYGTLHAFSFDVEEDDLAMSKYVLVYHADGKRVRAVVTDDEFEKQYGEAMVDSVFEQAEMQLEAAESKEEEIEDE